MAQSKFSCDLKKKKAKTDKLKAITLENTWCYGNISVTKATCHTSQDQEYEQLGKEHHQLEC